METGQVKRERERGHTGGRRRHSPVLSPIAFDFICHPLSVCMEEHDNTTRTISTVYIIHTMHILCMEIPTTVTKFALYNPNTLYPTMQCIFNCDKGRISFFFYLIKSMTLLYKILFKKIQENQMILILFYIYNTYITLCNIVYIYTHTERHQNATKIID